MNTTAASAKKLLLIKPVDLRKMKLQRKETDELIYCQSLSPKGWTIRLGPNMLRFKPRWKRTIFFLVTMTPKPRRTRSHPRQRHLAPNPRKGKQEMTTMNLVFWNLERLILSVAVRPDDVYC